MKAPRPAPPFLYRTFTVDVRPRALADVMRGLEAVAAHARCEPGTRLCAWFQSTVQPTRLLHVLVVDDEAAERVHRSSGPARQLAFMLERGATHAGSVTEWTVLAGI